MSWNDLSERILADGDATAADALAVLESPDDELVGVLLAAYRLRYAHSGREVRIHVLQNAKSGLCPEDCGFCSQSVRNPSPVPSYQLQSVAELVAGAREARLRRALPFEDSAGAHPAFAGDRRTGRAVGDRRRPQGASAKATLGTKTTT